MGAIKVCNWGLWLCPGASETASLRTWQLGGDQRLIRSVFRGIWRNRFRLQEQQGRGSEGRGSVCWKWATESGQSKDWKRGRGQSRMRQREGEARLPASFTDSGKPEGLCPYRPSEAVSGYETKVYLFDPERQLICWILTPKSNLGTWIVYFHNLNTPQVVWKKKFFLSLGHQNFS